MKLWAIGPGESTLHYKKSLEQLSGSEAQTLAFQSVFPWGYKFYDIIPTYWTWLDPNAAIEGLEFLDHLVDTAPNYDALQKMHILIPHFLADTYETFRLFSGTSALKETKWNTYQRLIEDVARKGFRVDILEATTVKYLQTVRGPYAATEDYCDKNFNQRFTGNFSLVCGTAAFDSETVYDMHYKWGLENKVSSAIFPIAQYLGTKELYIMGFDFVGKRFYDYGTDPENWAAQTGQQNYVAGRHAAANTEQLAVALGYVQKWIDTTELHQMEIYSVIEDKYTLINSVVPYRSFTTALQHQGDSNEGY